MDVEIAFDSWLLFRASSFACRRPFLRVFFPFENVVGGHLSHYRDQLLDERDLSLPCGAELRHLLRHSCKLQYCSRDASGCFPVY